MVHLAGTVATVATGVATTGTNGQDKHKDHEGFKGIRNGMVEGGGGCGSIDHHGVTKA